MSAPYTASAVTWVAQAAIPTYTRFLNAATGSANWLSCFKSQPAFHGPVGYTSGDYAAQCLSHSNACTSASILPVSAAINDTYGSPFSSKFNGGTIGWDTCRFLDSVAHIAERFCSGSSASGTGSMSGKTIYEFGANYGGLMTCLLIQWDDVANYYINDLPEVVDFNYYYTQQLEISAGFTHSAVITHDVTGSADYTGSIDLFISEYTLTEMDSGSMYAIYDAYGKNANGVFIRANLTAPSDFNAFLAHIEQDFTCSVIPETISRSQNKIIIGHKSGSW